MGGLEKKWPDFLAHRQESLNHGFSLPGRRKEKSSHRSEDGNIKKGKKVKFQGRG